jgi:hypothetical protein
VRAVARNEMELDPGSVSCQPFLNQDSMMVPGIVEKDVLPPCSWVWIEEFGLSGYDLDTQALLLAFCDVTGLQLASLDTMQHSLT